MAMETWKRSRPDLKNVPVTYAGRLDPMASGKLLVLLGEECKKKDSYLNLDKEYEIEVLLDIGSDTGDALGLVTYSNLEVRTNPKMLASILKNEEGAHMRSYPAFSSKPAGGIPLFKRALMGTLDEVETPEHMEVIRSIKYTGSYTLSTDELKKGIEEYLEKVPKNDERSKEVGADFRIHDVRASWKELWSGMREREFRVLRLRVSCGSGSYMRTLAGRIGEALGTKSLALSIRRTKLGREWNGVWLKSY